MSELTECNFCTLTSMRIRAARRGVSVILARDEDGWVTARYSNETEPVAFFLELSSECAC